MKDYTRVWAEIDLDAFYNNVIAMKEAVGEASVKLCAVIKSDGYGHGAAPIARTIDPLVWGYAVATFAEARNLRENGIEKPVLILGFVDERDFKDCIRLNLRLAFYDSCMTEPAIKAVREYREETGDNTAALLIHVKLDTGMGRIGFMCYDEEHRRSSVAAICEALSHDELKAEGCFMHFSKGDERDKSFAMLQHDRFMETIGLLKKEGISFSICHCDNSAGIIDMPKWHCDMVRMGITLYGMYPSDEVDKTRLSIRPCLSLRSRLVFIKTVPAGTMISYGGTYITKKEMRIGTVPVGYADGYSRALSNKGSVLICGKRAPIVGRVCMDQFMVDLSGIPEAKRFDEVTLIGEDGSEAVTADELAGLIGTINYELVCDISKRVPRVYYRSGKRVGSKDYFDDIYEPFD